MLMAQVWVFFFGGGGGGSKQKKYLHVLPRPKIACIDFKGVVNDLRFVDLLGPFGARGSKVTHLFWNSFTGLRKYQTHRI